MRNIPNSCIRLRRPRRRHRHRPRHRRRRRQGIIIYNIIKIS